MDFTFYTAGEIIFGPGKLKQIGELALRFGKNAMIVTRGDALFANGTMDHLKAALKEAGVRYFQFNPPAGEPTVSDVDKGADIARRETPDVIIGIGGGSSIDLGKAISGLATNPGSVQDYLEGVGKELQIENQSVPYIAVPTTAGTGSEVTKNAVISSDGPGFKKSIRSPFLIPNVALLDPELTMSLPANVTAETGMDALTQLIEAYVSSKKQPIPRALCLQGIKLAGAHLRRAVEMPLDLEAREAMHLASLLSGMALANSGLGAAHGIAAALGALAGVPHGRACAILLPHVMRENLASCIKDYCDIADALNVGAGLPPEKKAQMAVESVAYLAEDIQIPKTLSIDKSLLPELIKASQGSSMKGNPVVLSDEQIGAILEKIIE